jgi:threonine dehydratase
MLVGLQGSGKTTTIGKLANFLRKKHNKKPLLVAGDVYRPAAIDQLKQLGKQLNIEVYEEGKKDPVEICKNAIEYAKENHMSFIHPFDDELVQAGQGTIALEMLDEVSDLDYIVVPVGGGGLISGVASCAKQINPDIKIIGVSAKGAPAMFESFKDKCQHNSKSVRTIADGIAVRDASQITLSHILECVDEMVQVDDEEIANAILYLLEQQKIMVEGAGAVSVAAILENKFEIKSGAKIGAILSGGNIDVQTLSIIIEKGLLKSHRKMIINVTLIDKPGALMGLGDVLRSAGANIVKIDYDRFSTKLSYGDAKITITLETKGKEHQDTIEKALKDAGYEYTQEF